MKSLEMIKKQEIGSIRHEIMFLNNYKSENSYITRLLIDRIDKLYSDLRKLEGIDSEGL